MVQAAASGLIDFREMRFFNKPWQLKLRLLLKGLHQENERRLLTARQNYHAALLAIKTISEQSIERVQDRCQDDLHELTNLLRPWAATTREEREQKQVKTYRDRWQRRWGDLSAPETQRKIEETARALERMREAAPPPNAMGDWFGIFNAQTAQTVEGMRALKHATSANRN